MQNKLMDLNNHLFAELERLSDEDTKGEQLVEEINRACAITCVAKNIVDNAELMFKAQKHYDEYGTSNGTPDLLRLDSGNDA